MIASEVRMCNIYYIVALQIWERKIDRGGKNRSETDLFSFQVWGFGVCCLDFFNVIERKIPAWGIFLIMIAWF